MKRDIWIGLFIGAMVGIAIGGFTYRVKSRYDGDLVKYVVPTEVPTKTPKVEPSPTTTTWILAEPPEGWCICPTPQPTLTDAEKKARQEEDAEADAQREANRKRQEKIYALHGNDFVPFPQVKTTYEGYPVEFLMDDITGPLTDTLEQSEHDKTVMFYDYYDLMKRYESKTKENTGYGYVEAFDVDKTMINGYSRADAFAHLSKKNFEALHKPFYGIKVIERIGSSGYEYHSENSNRWIYCVWSIKRNAPIPFQFPSQAIKLIKRQQGKDKR